MPPKKRKLKQPTQSQRQSQKVIVNIGSKSAPRKRSGGGGGGHRHNLAPTFITAPQVDYTPILAMLTQQTRSLQPEPLRNPVTPLSSVTQALPAEQMAGEAAIRRAGPTAGSFQPIGHMERQIEASLREKSPSLRSSSPSSRSSTPSSRRSISPSIASTQVTLPEGRASIATIKQMGAEEERGRVQREQKLKIDQTQGFRFLREQGRQAKIKQFNTELEEKRALTDEQKKLYRQSIAKSGINLTELSVKAQKRTREPRV